MGGILGSLGIDPFYLFVIVFILQLVIIVLLCMVYDKYKQLQRSYNVFMKGKNGKSLEKSIFKRFDRLQEIEELAEENRKEIDKLYEKIKNNYQKIGIVKYDAFHEMGGELSFALTMLDENNTGWILNAMHSREGCYTYIKEVVEGGCEIELAAEEEECLERAIYQDEYETVKASRKKKEATRTGNTEKRRRSNKTRRKTDNR